MQEMRQDQGPHWEIGFPPPPFPWSRSLWIYRRTSETLPCCQPFGMHFPKLRKSRLIRSSHHLAENRYIKAGGGRHPKKRPDQIGRTSAANPGRTASLGQPRRRCPRIRRHRTYQGPYLPLSAKTRTGGCGHPRSQAASRGVGAIKQPHLLGVWSEVSGAQTSQWRHSFGSTERLSCGWHGSSDQIKSAFAVRNAANEPLA